MNMTKKHLATLKKLRLACDAATDAVYAAAPDRDTPLSECLRMADAKTFNAYDSARRALWDFQQQMVDERRAWRESNSIHINYYDPRADFGEYILEKQESAS